MTPPTPGDSNAVYVVVLSEDGPDGFTFEVDVSSGAVYRIEANDDLFGTNWILIDVVTAASAILTFTDTNAAPMPVRFYRLSDN